jgi:hypothetical protein
VLPKRSVTINNQSSTINNQLLRISVGIEDTDDLVADFKSALDACLESKVSNIDLSHEAQVCEA